MTPDGAVARPTSQKAREALFSIIADRIIDSVFIDMFAGSGAVGIEALSRGARKVVFVERNRSCIKVIRDNLAMLQAGAGEATIINADVSRNSAMGSIVAEMARIGESAADIIFADPPYDYADIPRLQANIADSDFFAEDSVFILECGKKADTAAAAAAPANLVNYTAKAYGETRLLFYRRKNMMHSEE